MDSQILRLLIFSLLVTVSFCLVSPLAEFNGTLPNYPSAQVLKSFNFTGYPGAAFLEIQAYSSVIVCVSPYVSISSNLATNCPNPINFDYASPLTVNEFLLFLDDFSLNFLSQDNSPQRKRLQDVQVAPYSPQTAQIPLLQNTQYFVSISLTEETSNVTLTQADLILENQFSQCSPGTVPNISYNGTGTRCQDLKAELNQNTSSHRLLINKKKPLLISFDVETFSYSAQLDFHIFSKEYDFTIYFGFEYAPTEGKSTFNYSNSGAPANLIESEFLGDIVQSFSVNITNPKLGTYYALITSNLTDDTDFDVEFNTSSCNLGTADCGGYDITTYLSSDTNVTNITFSNVQQYLAVLGENIILGIDVNNSGSAFIQMDINAIPTATQMSSFEYNNVTTVLTLSYDAPVDNDTFVFGFLNADALAQDSFTALVWTGSLCPGNCSSKGTCDTTTTLCSCNSGYEGRYCETETSSHKKLSTLYIILIIIGGAILLAILIGVPVALFLNNRKKARYERV